MSSPANQPEAPITPAYSGTPAARFSTPTPEPADPPLHPPYAVVLAKAGGTTAVHAYAVAGHHEPEEVADLLIAYERGNAVDVLDVDPASRWSGPDLDVPERAWIVVVADNVLETPRASVVLFAGVNTNDVDALSTADQIVDAVQPKVGFFYGLERSEDAAFSLKAWADAMVAGGHLERLFTAGAGGETGAEPLLGMVQEAFHNELCWREVGLPLTYASGDAGKKCVYRKRGRADRGLEPEPLP